MSGKTSSRSIRWSKVYKTEPFDEFSNGTTPKEALEDCTASKTSENHERMVENSVPRYSPRIESSFLRTYLESSKESTVAYLMSDLEC